MTDDANGPLGYIGLGIMGAAMVSSLRDAALECVVYDLAPAAIAAVVEKGAVGAASIADVARQCRVVSVCVPADAHVRAVLDGPDGLLVHLTPGSVIAIHSTLLPETIEWAGAEAAAKGIGLVEAPVTGGQAAALVGELTFLLAGEDWAVAALEPLLAACGSLRIPCARLGDANRLKLCINLNTYGAFMAAFEASRMARDLGLDPADLHAAMEGNGQLTPMIKRFLMIHAFDDVTIGNDGVQRMLAGQAAIVRKDLELMGRVLASEGGEASLIEVLENGVAAAYRLTS